MKFLLVCLILAGLFGCTPPFSYDLYDYRTDGISLGIAFPSVQTAAALAVTLDSLDDLNIRNTRIGESWKNRETSDGVFNWEPLETRLDAFSAAGVKVLLSIESHEWPSWLDTSGSHAETATLNQFRSYVHELLRLYGQKIYYIQFGNEWNWEIDDFFNGDEAAFIAYSNILNEEVTAYRTQGGFSGPLHVLGSFSGGNALAFDQGLITGIVIGDTEVYRERTQTYASLPETERMTVRTLNILQNTDFELIDIHLYDNSQDWDKCITAYNQALFDSGKPDMPLIVSEFGGPWAVDLYTVFGKPSPDILAQRLVEYVHTLDALPVETAYFFKLNKDLAGVYHNYSYLIDLFGCRMPAFEVLRRFGSQ